MANWQKVLAALAALASIGAGLYLLTSGSSSEQFTVFDALFQGIGLYFIARGLWMAARMDPR